MSTRQCSYTQYIYYIQPITGIVLPVENIITRLFIYSCRDQVILPPYDTSLRLVSLMLGLSNALFMLLLLCQMIYYPPPIFGCFNVYICYYVILDIDNNTTLLKFN